MLREMDDGGLDIVCEIVNRYMKGEHLEALAHRDLDLLPRKPAHGIRAIDRPLTNLVLPRKVVSLVVKEEEHQWLREHGFLPPSRFAFWPGTSVWDFLRVLHDYFWHGWASGCEAWPIVDDVRHAFGSPDHLSRDSVHQVVGDGPDLCRSHRSLVEDVRLHMGRTDDVDHAVGWFDAGSGQGCPLSPLDYAPLGEVWKRMVSTTYPGVHTPAGLLHSLAWADDRVWLGHMYHRCPAQNIERETNIVRLPVAILGNLYRRACDMLLSVAWKFSKTLGKMLGSFGSQIGPPKRNRYR